MTRKLTYLYFILLSFTSAFSITPVVTPCVIILTVLTIFFFYDFSLGKSNFYYTRTDLILFAFWLITFTSFILNFNEFISGKPVNHLFAYTFVIIGNYFLLKNILINSFLRQRISFSKVVTYIGIGVLITSLYGLTEFIFKNIFSIDIENYVPRAAVTNYAPLATSFIRIRSFVEESGHLSQFYELLAPLGLYGLRKNEILYYLTLISTIICFLLTFSTAGWIIVAVVGTVFLSGYVFKIITKFNGRIKINSIAKTVTMLILLIAFVVYVYDVIGKDLIDNIVVSKITNSGSADDRTSRAVMGNKAFLDFNLFHFIFGYGPAAYDTLRLDDATIILYQTFILETGILGLFLFLLFVSITLYQSFFIEDKTLKIIFISSIISGLLHFIFIANYWYPWFWVILILSQTVKKQKITS